MKKLLLLLLLPLCLSEQEEQADTLDLDYYLFLSNENGWCSLQAYFLRVILKINISSLNDLDSPIDFRIWIIH